MMNEFPSKSFWAFQQHKEAIKNIFNMQKGDRCLFIKGIANEGMSMSRNPKLNFQYNGWDLTTVKEPYYMALDTQKELFLRKKILQFTKVDGHFLYILRLLKVLIVRNITFQKRIMEREMIYVIL